MEALFVWVLGVVTVASAIYGIVHEVKHKRTEKQRQRGLRFTHGRCTGVM